MKIHYRIYYNQTKLGMACIIIGSAHNTIAGIMIRMAKYFPCVRYYMGELSLKDFFQDIQYLWSDTILPYNSSNVKILNQLFIYI